MMIWSFFHAKKILSAENEYERNFTCVNMLYMRSHYVDSRFWDLSFFDENTQKASFLTVVFLHILYFQTDLVRTTNTQDMFLNEMCFLFFSLCTLSWFNYVQTMLEIHYVNKIKTFITIIPVVFSVVLLLLNTLNGCLFVIDQNGFFRNS